MSREQIALEITINGQRVTSETTHTWAGAHALCIHSAIPGDDLAIELHSTFLGAPGALTRSTHLLLGPIGRPPTGATLEHPHELVDPTFQPRSCVYAHAHQLIELATEHGLRITVEIPGDHAFTALERVGAHNQ